jgi:hypothetical protein
LAEATHVNINDSRLPTPFSLSFSLSDWVEAAVKDGVDIIPAILEVNHFEPPRRVANTELGTQIRSGIELLLRLLTAYRTNKLRQIGELSV